MTMPFSSIPPTVGERRALTAFANLVIASHVPHEQYRWRGSWQAAFAPRMVRHHNLSPTRWPLAPLPVAEAACLSGRALRRAIGRQREGNAPPPEVAPALRALLVAAHAVAMEASAWMAAMATAAPDAPPPLPAWVGILEDPADDDRVERARSHSFYEQTLLRVPRGPLRGLVRGMDHLRDACQFMLFRGTLGIWWGMAQAPQDGIWRRVAEVIAEDVAMGGRRLGVAPGESMAALAAVLVALGRSAGSPVDASASHVLEVLLDALPSAAWADVSDEALLACLVSPSAALRAAAATHGVLARATPAAAGATASSPLTAATATDAARRAAPRHR